MSKNFPINKQTDYTIVNSDTLVANASTYANELNGQLDSDNLPLYSLDATKFKRAEVETTSGANFNTTEWIGQTQAYYKITRTSLDYETTIFEPVETIDLKNDSWKKGWNRLADYGTFDGFQLNLDAQEGMLNGCVNIDFHHGFNAISYSAEPTLHATTGEGWWTRWGVFVNGVLVSDSGKCYPRGENLVLPFSIPTGTQSVRIEVKFQTITTRSLNVSSYTGDPTTPLDIYGCVIWARNTWR